jgi:hypothetical protein
MGFTRTVPSSLSELEMYMQKIHDNRGHVNSVTVNMTTGHLEVDLDRMANFAGNPDVYLPLRRNKIEPAKILVDRMMRQSAAGQAPSHTDVKELYDMIDPQGQ